MDRRQFTLGSLGIAAGLVSAPQVLARPAAYRGPNVVLVRFGGGVRRAETIDEAATYAPYLRHVLAPRGTFIPDLRIDRLEGVNTSHAEGTLNLLTGRYLAYRELSEVLLVNGEDRPQEEFITFGAGDHFGVEYRSEMLSLHRYKLYRTAMQLTEGRLLEDQLLQVQEERLDLLTKDPRGATPDPSPEVTDFWARWRRDFGDTGFKNPRGDRLLTELSVRAMAELQPRFLMVNYQDPDYVHWGNPSHYTRAIAIIDEGLQRLVSAADADPFYRGNTIFVITPDCGRDANPLAEVPFQHHFNSRSAHETWAVIFGPGIGKGVIDKPVDQSAIAPTIAAAMGFTATRAEGRAVEEMFL